MSNNQTTTGRFPIGGAIQRAGLVVVLAALFAALSTSPAAADPPRVVTVSETATSVNPCTGLEHELTFELELRTHAHGDEQFVTHIRKTGTTDDGYVLRNGVGRAQENGNIWNFGANEIWRNADGSAFRLHLAVVIELPAYEVRTVSESLTCIRS